MRPAPGGQVKPPPQLRPAYGHKQTPAAPRAAITRYQAAVETPIADWQIRDRIRSHPGVMFSAPGRYALTRCSPYQTRIRHMANVPALRSPYVMKAAANEGAHSRLMYAHCPVGMAARAAPEQAFCAPENQSRRRSLVTFLKGLPGPCWRSMSTTRADSALLADLAMSLALQIRCGGR